MQRDRHWSSRLSKADSRRTSLLLTARRISIADYPRTLLARGSLNCRAHQQRTCHARVLRGSVNPWVCSVFPTPPVPVAGPSTISTPQTQFAPTYPTPTTAPVVAELPTSAQIVEVPSPRVCLGLCYCITSLIFCIRSMGLFRAAPLRAPIICIGANIPSRLFREVLQCPNYI